MPKLDAPSVTDDLRLSLQVSAVSDALHAATGAPRDRCERYAAFAVRALTGDLRLLAYCGMQHVTEHTVSFTSLPHERRIGIVEGWVAAYHTATLAAANLLPYALPEMRTLLLADAERERFRPRSRELVNRTVTGRSREPLKTLDGDIA